MWETDEQALATRRSPEKTHVGNFDKVSYDTTIGWLNGSFRAWRLEGTSLGERLLRVESQNSKYGSTAVFRLQMVVRRAQTCLGVWRGLRGWCQSLAGPWREPRPKSICCTASYLLTSNASAIFLPSNGVGTPETNNPSCAGLHGEWGRCARQRQPGGPECRRNRVVGYGCETKAVQPCAW